MKKTGLSEALINEICQLAEKYHIRQVVLFGSRARGDYHRASDIDLAVSGGDILHFTFDVDEETSTPLKYDVINLNLLISKELRESIDREGIILYEEV